MMKLILFCALASMMAGATAADDQLEHSAGVVANDFLAKRFIVAGRPDIHSSGDAATVYAQVSGLTCRLDLKRDLVANRQGWVVDAMNCKQAGATN